jgi:hypothetical protein
MGERAELGHQNLREHHGRCARRDCHGYRSDAADAAAVGANCIRCAVRRRGRLIGDNAMTNNVIGLRDRISGGLGGTEIRNEASERNRVSGGQRNNALPQCPLRKPHAHNRSPPLVDTNILAAKKFHRQRESLGVGEANRHAMVRAETALATTGSATYYIPIAYCVDAASVPNRTLSAWNNAAFARLTGPVQSAGDI